MDITIKYLISHVTGIGIGQKKQTTRVMTSENIEIMIIVGVTYLLLKWLNILGWSRDISTSGLILMNISTSTSSVVITAAYRVINRETDV